MQNLIGLFVGIAAGTHIATWGMYKDAPHEGFTAIRYGRSIAIGAVIGTALARFLDITAASPGSLLLLFGLTYAGERVVIEFWKTFLREEDQSKYFIPMQFHVGRRLVHNRFARAAAGGLAIGLAVMLLLAANALVHTALHVPRLVLVGIVGSLGGWYSAIGGASKDGPIEGFDLLKFFRSPILASVYAMLLSPFESDPVLLAFAGLGFTIATLETYKTFFFPSKPRGKFAGKPVLFPEMLIRRRRFVPAYAAIWAGLVASFVAGYSPYVRSATATPGKQATVDTSREAHRPGPVATGHR